MIGGGVIIFLIFLIIGFLIGRRQADARYSSQINAQTASAIEAQYDVSGSEVTVPQNEDEVENDVMFSVEE